MTIKTFFHRAGTSALALTLSLGALPATVQAAEMPRVPNMARGDDGGATARPPRVERRAERSERRAQRQARIEQRRSAPRAAVAPVRGNTRASVDRVQVRPSRAERRNYSPVEQVQARRDAYDARRDRAERREDRRDRREDRADRRDDRRDWRGDRRDDRQDWRGDRRDDRRDWRNDRREWQRDRRADRREWREDRRDHRAWNRSWRNDRRYDWHRYRASNRHVYHLGRYYAPYRSYSYRRLNIGFQLGSLFYGSRYWINNPSYYRLPPAYGSYRWVRYYDDALLVNLYTGEVVDVIYDFFW